MNILLINNNPVVSRLVSLCVRDDAINFEEVDHVTKAGDVVYDIVFVDDASYNDKVKAFLNWVAQAGKVVFFSSRESGEEIGEAFDTVIKKPFLPSRVQEVIERVKESAPVSDGKEKDASELPESSGDMSEPVSKETEEETHFISPLSLLNENEAAEEEPEPLSLTDDLQEEEDNVQPTDSKVLDGREIAQIKALLEEDEEAPLIDPEEIGDIEARKVEVITKKLEEDGLEIVGEEEIIDALSEEPKKKKQNKSKKCKKKSKEEVYTFEEALLAAVENVKPKKIKKLLKGAEVTIKIRFKDEG